MSLSLRGRSAGGGSSQYASLFRAGAGRASDFARPSRNFNNSNAYDDFARKFGFGRTLNRNDNLIDVIQNPVTSLKRVNNQIGNISIEKAERYQDYLSDLRTLGYSDAEATERADVMIGREIENDLFLLQASEPYAVGGAAAGGWDPVNTVLRENRSMRELPNNFRAIGSSGGLGVGGGKKITKKKGLKRRLRAKYKK